MAEVSDKMPTIADHWRFAIPAAIIGFLIASYRWQLGVAFLLVPLLMFDGIVYLFFFDTVGRGLMAEQGIEYLVSKIGSASFVLATCIVGIMIARRRVVDSANQA